MRPRVGTKCCSIRSPAPGGLCPVGQYLEHLRKDAEELSQDPARQAAAAKGDQCDNSHHPALAPGELGVGEEVPRLVEKEAHTHDQEPELNPESQPAQDLASLPQGRIARCFQRPRVHDSGPFSIPGSAGGQRPCI